MNIPEPPEVYTLVVKTVNFMLHEFSPIKQKQKNYHYPKLCKKKCEHKEKNKVEKQEKSLG